MNYDVQWTIDTLEDALQELSTLLDDLENSKITPQEALNEELTKVYAKLNFAYHTAQLGPNAIETENHNQLIAWPKSKNYLIFNGN